MIGRGLELLAIPVRALRRAGLIWSLSLAALVALTVAFWPSFRDQAAIDELLEGLPEPLVDAFGLADLSSPAGFLDANLYAVLVPLLLAVAGVILMNGQTAGDEDSGRMEAYLAQPVSRPAVFLGRALGVLLWMAIIGAVVLGVQLVANAVVAMDIGAERLVATVVLCTLLGLLHAGLAAFVAGLTARPGLVLGIGLAVAIAGYVAVALFPISDVLEPWKVVSPWEWALGGDPLREPTEAWRYAVLAVPTLVLVVLGAAAFNARDVHAA
ncbi:MAG TPA: ABC transporter permease subunit [candidate division Zixibacteria bacterium]|nr:ABC transporter permease subunit [candidate division Zixibacteria bacterium]